MARQQNKLTAIQVKNLKAEGYHHDGAGLYLKVTTSGAKSWLFCYRFNGRSREMGLGSENQVSLAEARIRMQEARKILANKQDPLEIKKKAEAKARLEAAKNITFKECATAYIDAHKNGWRNDKTAQQWPRFFEKYVYTVIGHLPVDEIDLNLVLRILEPIWTKKTETADRLRSRIERILDWAKVRGYREGENPARWRGHLSNLLANPSKIHKVKHHKAMPHIEVGNFMERLKQQPGMDARVLAFTILTAVRTNEATQAHWEEIDLEKKLWVLSAERTKTGKEHRVPLSDEAIRVLHHAAHVAGLDKTQKYSGWVFPSSKGHKAISNMAMLMLLRRMERKDITVHGFRSTFRDWTAERTNYPREVAEAALAHVVENKVEAAYLRSDLFDKRRKLMDAWARHCTTPINNELQDNIVNLNVA